VLTVRFAFVCALFAVLLLAQFVVAAAGVPLLSVIGLAHIFHFVAEKE